MMLQFQDSKLRLDRFPGDVIRDPGFLELVDMAQEYLVAFYPSFAACRVMSYYGLASEIAGKEEFPDSNVNRNEDFPEPSTFDVNLAVSGDGPETCQLQRCPHYLLR